MRSCNLEDGEGRCTANDGLPCDACEKRFDAEASYWRNRWHSASPEERDPDGYARYMVDAGRGHLVRGAW